MKKNINEKIIVGVFIFVFLLVPFSFLGENVEAVETASDQVTVTLDVTTGITISVAAPDPVVMAPNIGIASDGSIGSSSWTVRTNALLGYTLAIKASTAPALVSGANSFADYTEASSGVPEVWSVASGAKEFGYSAYGTDTDTAVWGTAASCGVAGVPDSAQKYVGTKITDKTVATRAVVTPTTGIATTVCFAAQQNAVFAPSGTYTATITATATTL